MTEEAWVSVVRAVVRAQRRDAGVTASSVLRARMPRGKVLLAFRQRAEALARELVALGWTPPDAKP